MPLLAFVTGHGRRLSPEHNSADRSAIVKEQLRKAADSHSNLSLQHGLLGPVEDQWSRPTPKMDSVKRSSIGNLLSPARRTSASTPKAKASKSARLWVAVESPPLISYNVPESSTGALFSAQLHIEVAADEVKFESVQVRILCVVTVKKPVHANCPECTTKVTELKKIDLAQEALRLKRGDHPIPFSYLFGGHLPATTRAGIAQLEYYAVAEAKTSTGETITLSQKAPDGTFLPLPENRFTIKLLRSILPPQNDKHSVRVFPPTNLTANVFFNPVIYPIGEFQIQLRLSGMTSGNNEQLSRWRLKKTTWRVEEKQKMISPACAKHGDKLGGEGKGIFHEEVRMVGEGEVDQHKNPWKTSPEDGDVESEFKFSVNPRRNAVCSVSALNGLNVTHALVIEMIVAEEWAPKAKPRAMTTTGTARILRMQFNLLMTQRQGLGVSWDEETPPVYENVPESPPHYANMTEFNFSTEAGQFEELHLDLNTGAGMPTPAGSSATPRALGPSPAVNLPSGLGRYRLNADDLLSTPMERVDTAVESDEDEDDVGVVGEVTAAGAS